MSHLDLTQVGKYQILDLVGEGAMGVVYRALDPVLNRVVAIKVMGDGIARNDEHRNRFLREAQAAGSLQHPNVITIFDFGEVEGHLFIAMEYLEGSDLAHLLAQHTPLSIAEKLDIAIDVLSGLAFAHKRGLVHRDVKPANIRVTEDGRAKIMDFGIVHLSSSDMTKTGVALGTPDYMAPEQIAGGRVTPSTDIFAMGAVTYELLTGARPFHAETLHAVMYKIVSDDPPPIDKVLPGLPTGLSPIMERALKKDPAKRYESALDFANALSEIRASLADAKPTTPRTLSLRTTIDSGLAEAKARASNPSPAPPSRAIASSRIVVAAAGAVAVAGLGWYLATRPPGGDAVRPIQAGATRVTQDSAATQLAAPVAPPPAAPEVSTARNERSTSGDPQSEKTTRELAVYRSVETSSLRVRQRAIDAGVPRTRLATGDALQRQAIAFLADGRIPKASEELGRAAEAWSSAHTAWNAQQTASAETSSRPQTPANTSGAPTPSQTQAQPQNTVVPPVNVQVAPPSTQSASPVSTPPITRPPIPEPETPAATEAAIGAAISAYARAIESRDLAAVRRVNPGLTSGQQNGFDQFFRAVRSIRAKLTVVSSEVTGNNAEARLTGAYDYVTTKGESVHQPLSFQATLRRENGVWKLTAVR
jgi:eukaryotic-like serine/threonine-protein kinase